MSIGRDSERAARLGFYATGIGVYVLWNLGTAVGVLGASWLSEPRVLGLDAAVPAAFLALLAPGLQAGRPGRSRSLPRWSRWSPSHSCRSVSRC